jgi:hypothetical protein
MNERSVVRSLHLQVGPRMFRSAPPTGFRASLGPRGHAVRADDRGMAAGVLAFVDDPVELESPVPSLARSLNEVASPGVAHPRSSSGVPSDTKRGRIWEWGRAKGVDAPVSRSLAPGPPFERP